MVTTTVINFFGASGVGKSTVAASLYADMKVKEKDCELVQEFVKTWAWQNRKPTKFDQAYLFGKQSRRESLLYYKVDYIITDSPILLTAFYEELYSGRKIIHPAVINFLEYTGEHSINQVNFWLERRKKYNPKGRYENEEESRIIHKKMREWLDEHEVPLIDVPSDRNIQTIIEHVEGLAK